MKLWSALWNAARCLWPGNAARSLRFWGFNQRPLDDLSRVAIHCQQGRRRSLGLAPNSFMKEAVSWLFLVSKTCLPTLLHAGIYGPVPFDVSFIRRMWSYCKNTRVQIKHLGSLHSKAALTTTRGPGPWFTIPSFYFIISILLGLSLIIFPWCMSEKHYSRQNLLVLFWAYCLNFKSKSCSVKYMWYVCFKGLSLLFLLARYLKKECHMGKI